MAEIIRDIGSLTELKNELKKRKIIGFHSVKEISNFISEYQSVIYKLEIKIKGNLKNEIIEKNNILLKDKEIYNENKKEKKILLLKELNENQLEYNELINKPFSFFSFLKNNNRKIYLKNRILNLSQNFNNELEKYFYNVNHKIDKLNSEIEYLQNNFEKIIVERIKADSSEINRKKKEIEELYPVIAGAIGENKALSELKKLDDTSTIINDVYIEFEKPIYNQQTNDYIYSIQIDHIVISKAGIFVVETKNWSKKSIESLDLFSPVNQLKRSSYALFILIHNAIENEYLKLYKHHWGDKKIPIKNILLMVGEKPKGEFQFVKLLSINEVLGYINYFQPILEDKDVKKITKFILKMIDD